MLEQERFDAARERPWTRLAVIGDEQRCCVEGLGPYASDRTGRAAKVSASGGHAGPRHTRRH
jgi:hypothetical protein